MWQTFGPLTEVRDQRQMCERDVRQPQNTQAAHLQQPGEGGGRGGLSVSNVHPIVRHEFEPTPQESQHQIRLARTGRPDQEHRLATPSDTTAVHAMRTLHGLAIWTELDRKESGLSGVRGRASVWRIMTDRFSIAAAAARISPYVRHTPLMRLDRGEFGVPVALKLELLQHTGSFKPRGAFNRMLTADLPAAGVIAASGGNHGAAVAYAARALGVTAEIFVPGGTPDTKVSRIRGYGARVVQGGDTYAEALAASRERQAVSGALEVHAYDHQAVLAGQGTVGREFEADAPDLTHILVATGGGGLIGGIAAWYAGAAQIVSVEPEGCPGLHNALMAGQPVDAPVGGLAADALGARRVGSLMFEVARRHGVVAVLVEDSAILAAQRFLWDRFRLIAEPGGATALAALLSERFIPPEGARVGVLVCGANTDPAKVAS